MGALTKKQQELVAALETLYIEEFIYAARGFSGRLHKDRSAIAQTFGALWFITCWLTYNTFILSGCFDVFSRSN
jgi:hypothetical protein